MSDPFANVRRKPAAATYGRRALAARRVGSQSSAASGDAVFGLGSGSAARQPHAPVASLSSPTIGGDTIGSTDASDSDGSPSALLPADAKSGEAGDRPWARRTAQSAMSKLESLYESTQTKAATPGSLSARAILDSAKNAWDLGEISDAHVEKAVGLERSRKPAHATEVGSGQQTRRAERNSAKPNNSAASVAAKAPCPTKSKSEGLAAKKAATSIPTSTTARSVTKPDAPPIQTTAKPVAGKVAKGAAGQTKRARSSACGDSNTNREQSLDDKPGTRQSACLQLQAVESPSKVAKAMRGSRAVPVHPSASANTAPTSDSPWDMDDLLASSPLLVQKKATRRPAARSMRGRKAPASSDIASSSPPSTPGRLLDLGRSSRPSSSLGDSDCDGTFAAMTPKAQVGSRRTLEAIQGPSLATSKRLQARAFSQNVVYTYGRTRDDDELEEGFGRALAIPGVLGINSQPLLEHRESDADSDSADGVYSGTEPKQSRCLPVKWRGTLTSDSNGHGDSASRRESTVPFKKQLGAIIHGINASSGGSAVAACCQLLDGLESDEFCEELLSSKSWLPTLLQSMHRARDDPAVLPTAMLVIAMAFGVPTTMQTLVFERQVLETVAEILKPAVETELLLLRHRRDFASAEYHRCTAQICYLSRKYSVISDSLPLSTYNLALAALHSFARSDDAAFLAMARLLRSEVRESGCLGLVIERVFTWSTPGFVDMQRRARSARPEMPSRSPFDDPRASTAFSTSWSAASRKDGALGFGISDDDDLWMDFDLPEEEKLAATGRRKEAPVANIRRRPRTAAAGATPTSLGSLGKAHPAERQLLRELNGNLPSFASVALELEILRFCTTESADNQSEVLAIDSCVPLLLALLAMCQQASAQQQGAALVRALEIAALTLQLLVNLSNSSTVFCARFIACKGLDVVSKSIAFVSQKLDKSASSIGHSTSEFSPRRKELVDNVSDLRYDILLVTSALLTNVVDSDPSSALYFSHVLQSPQCALDSRCFPECACKGRLPLAVLLTRAFLACHSASAVTDAAVAAGYLSVLLGLLVREKTAGRESILRLLPDQSTAALIAHIEGFIRVSDAVNQRFAGLFGGLAFMSQATSTPIVSLLQHGHRPLLTQGAHQAASDTRIVAGAPGKGPATQSKIAASLRAVIDMLGSI
ncbi:hypothetical protein GGF42_003859 [Coemansia sp. RSA 2424]|nr:hypothetical protein GGF42_003859 [Coemansia sp. RSA 2424]